MDTTSIFVILTGLFVRLGVPLIVTALVILALRKLDARWQAEAEAEHASLLKDESGCWKERGLSMDEIKLRNSKSETPCWQQVRLPNGYLREDCLECEVFLSAPIPEQKHAQAHV